ncbi:MAG TPA: MBL fold metallo-hydrolase [Candidatus Baltobacteraceae bacterium]|jgi:glyoxylase-like metal-dependent hydrolase (beta-lactamase superfamily II)|nr:MBL fold metallo-hydrolase [Candidatus Baltobacteraceae bacterium]
MSESELVSKLDWPSDRVGVLTAPNKTAGTLNGTNTYFLKSDSGLIIIDPGPDDNHRGHVDAIVRESRGIGLPIRAILLTHDHWDHSPGATRLRQLTKAPVYTHPSSDFPHDYDIKNDELLTFGDLEILPVYTPGHAKDHITFCAEIPGLGKILLTGDTVIANTTVYIPPLEKGGDMADYIASIKMLRQRFAGDEGAVTKIFGGHGDPVNDPAKQLKIYLRQRQKRGDDILEFLQEHPRGTSFDKIFDRLYSKTDPANMPMAVQTLKAYLEMFRKGGILFVDEVSRPANERERMLLSLPPDSNPDNAERREPPTSLPVFQYRLSIGRNLGNHR